MKFAVLEQPDASRTCYLFPILEESQGKTTELYHDVFVTRVMENVRQKCGITLKLCLAGYVVKKPTDAYAEMAVDSKGCRKTFGYDRPSSPDLTHTLTTEARDALQEALRQAGLNIPIRIVVLKY